MLGRMAEVWRGTRSSRAGFIWGVRCEGVFVNQRPVRGLLEVLQQIPDPRGREGQRHPWNHAVIEESGIEVWDGKTLRGTRQADRRAEQLLVRMDLILGRVVSSHAIPSETNEIQQASTLVGNLVLHGKLVIADALYCQREFCQGLVDQQADYVVTVKANQPQLLR